MNDTTFSLLSGWFDSGLNGNGLTTRYTSLIDSVLKDVFQVEYPAVQGKAGRRGKGAGQEAGAGLVLLATGGYGRREMAPFSDIDIMFLIADRSSPEIVERMLYRLWDLGLDISHAVRTQEECLEEAFTDVRTRTSLLEARYIAGDAGLLRLFSSRVLPELVGRKQKDFVREKLLERAKRHTTAGNSVYLLEPNIKEGEGGLRDIHTAFWLSKVALRTADYGGFIDGIPPENRRRFLSAHDFLLRCRFCLHLESRRKNDLLSFDLQRPVARRLGFRDSKKFTAVERMMRYYYLKSRAVVDTTAEIGARCSRLYISVPRDFNTKKISDNFSVSGGSIIASAEGVLSQSTDRIMEAFQVFSKTGKRFSRNLRKGIISRLLRINRRARTSPAAVGYFRSILKGGRVWETLREMHDTGVLGRFLPEFGALRMLVVHEPYHRYTVDEHTLVAIRNLEQLRTTSYKSLEDLHNVINTVGRLDMLFLALLLHDIGKAAGRHHEEEGYKRLLDIMERFNLDIDKRARIGFLVKNHILMSQIALKREVHDPDVIARFADAVGDVENLHSLYLITYADMSAVNPTFWNSWKAYMLRELYLQTISYLNGVTRDRALYLRELTGMVPERDRPAFASFIDDMPERYLLSTPKEKVTADYRLLRQAEEGGVAVRIDKRSDSLVEISVSTADSQGLFSKIVGFLTSKGLNIVNGRIFTGRSGLVIDKISVSNWQEVWWEGLAQDLFEGLRLVIAGEMPLTVGARREKNTSPYDIFIELDNEISDEFTVIEVFSPDRLGLLYDISRVLAGLGVSISLARINTESGLAHDIFSVTSEDRKIDHILAERLLSELWMTLRDA